jgi:hypothetical protein
MVQRLMWVGAGFLGGLVVVQVFLRTHAFY